MASTSSSKPKPIKVRHAKLTKRWQTRKQKQRNWLNLPSDLTADILLRFGAINMITKAQYVCTAWRNICHDPLLWRVVDMKLDDILNKLPRVRHWELREMCMDAVDLSQGQLVDISLELIDSEELLHYIADRSSQLRRLQLACLRYLNWPLSNVLQKIPSLEELSLCLTYISIKDIEAAANFCPLLKTLKINHRRFKKPRNINFYGDEDSEDDEEAIAIGEILPCDDVAIAIGKFLPELRHLHLIGNRMSNIGLQAILEGCSHLESLDLRGCPNVCLDGELGKRCFEQIKSLRIPSDSLEDYKFDDKKYDIAPVYSPYRYMTGSPCWSCCGYLSDYYDDGFHSDDWFYEDEDFTDFTLEFKQI